MSALQRSYYWWKKTISAFYISLNNYLVSRMWLSTLLVFTFFFLIFLWTYFTVSTVSSPDDQWFHFRFAQSMLKNGILGSFWHFKSIYFSKMASDQYFVYYNFLSYLFVIPFTFIHPLFLGMKLFAVVVASFIFTVFYWCAKRLGVRYAFLGVLAIFAIVNYASIWRYFLSRPYTVAPALLLFLIYFLSRRMYVAQFIISFLYLYWHCSTFFFPLIVVGCFFLFEGLYRNKVDWNSVFAVFGGVVTAIGVSYLLAPGFLYFVKDTEIGIYWQTIIGIGKKVPLPEGAELYPVNFFNYLQQNTLLISGLLIGIVVEIRKYFVFREQRKNGYFADSLVVTNEVRLAILRASLFLLSIGFFLGVITISLRFADFFIFFAGFYLILLFGEILNDIQLKTIYIKQSLIIGLFIVIGYLFVSNILLLQEQFANAGVAPYTMQTIGNWLATNTQKGDVVFNANWSWFTQLYYWSPDNNYVIGLEPRFLYDYNHPLYWKWWHITADGYVCDTENCSAQVAAQKKAVLTQSDLKDWEQTEGNLVATTILNDFHSKYIVTAQGLYPGLDILLENNNHFKLAVKDIHGYEVYKVIP